MQVVKSPYLSEKSSDFDEILYTRAYLELDDSQVTKSHMSIFKIQNGAEAAILNIVFWP